MMQGFFTSLSGLFGFSRGLDTVSNNITNMNTPGFRGSDAQFRNVVGGSSTPGYGTQISGTVVRTSQGDLRQTGNATDLALNGSGYFVLRDDAGNSFYTRSGQFTFNADGLLVDSISGFRVAGIDAAGNLVDITIADLRTLPPVATDRIDLTGNLLPTSTSHTIPSISVFDSTGATQNLSVTFTNNNAVTPNSWLVSIANASGTVVGTGELRFAADGTLTAGFTSVTATITVQGLAQAIVLDFGAAGSFSGTTQLAGGQSTLGMRKVNGHALAGLTEVSFDEQGLLHLTYSNGDKETGGRVAVAHFTDESALMATQSTMFTAGSVDTRQLGGAGEGIFARIAGGNLELSNVDLTQEFADLIILQRGYQASSRVMTVANEMVENLYNSTRNG